MFLFRHWNGSWLENLPFRGDFPLPRVDYLRLQNQASLWWDIEYIHYIHIFVHLNGGLNIEPASFMGSMKIGDSPMVVVDVGGRLASYPIQHMRWSHLDEVNKVDRCILEMQMEAVAWQLW